MQGPCFHDAIPPRRHATHAHSFLDYQVSSRYGVAAGPLLNAKWVALAASLGFDILTYKTIRSAAHPSHPLPNIVYLDPSMQRIPAPSSLEQLTITNSFGMPSQSPEFLLQDIAFARNSLATGQVLIVSVVGSHRQDRSFLADFLNAAALAKEAGAHIVEANFSCPNVDHAAGCLYLDLPSVYSYTQQLVRQVHPLPLILKIGPIPHLDVLRQLLITAARAGARGLCGLNSVSQELPTPLDATRKTSGVCGAAIRPLALAFLRNAHRLNCEERLNLTLLGCGGIVSPEHFEEFLTAGADIALSATGMMWDPYLALRAQTGALPKRRNP